MHQIDELLDSSSTIFSHIPYPTFLTDRDGRIIWWSREAEKQFGYSLEQIKGEINPLFNSSLTGHFSTIFERLLRNVEPVRYNSVHLHSSNGDQTVASVVAKSFTFKYERYVLFLIDNDYIPNSEESSFLELQLLKKGLSDSFMLVYLDKEGLITYANEQFLKKSNWTPKRILGKSFWQLFPNTPDHIAVADKIMQTLQRGENFQGTVEKVTKDGTNYWVNLLAISITDTKNNTLYYLLLEEEITEKKQLQSRLEQIAYVDTETGLMSRHRLEDVVTNYIKEDRNFSFVFISIDQFYTLKEIFNDQTESIMLIEFTKRLKIYFEETIIARMSRDEFSLITPLSDWYIQGFTNYLKQNPIYLNNKAIPITISGSITKYPEDQQSYLHLLKASNATMQKIKQEGGGTIASLSQSGHNKLSRALQIEKRLLEALNHNDLHVMYLPQKDMVTGKINAVEALVRWEDDVLGVVSPEELIPIAEETGLINEIGTFMLEKSCEQASIWQNKGLPIKVSFNSSIREFRDKNMVKTIRKMLEKYNCSPELLQIEFTEKFALEAEAEKSIIQQMQTLQQDGIVFALDDFGTGYASLRYLQLLPISKLKIDKNFIDSLLQQEKLQKLVQGLIQFGQSLDVQVVAEGVESEEQYTLLKEMGCDAIQGYYVSHPISSKEVEDLLRSEGNINN
ncbi:EAL domain-containing protein [Psychrobacillus vulpis]|uniref:EAL domain-containing protein n=1 Tax=Psychrobacillus vulpis TaxID=2325572 RepID=A0A544TSI8_9BACI|nr:EAL domain-containing protein [Psychrobacillus vulpis]TQR20408.1 EAL domain-containing protein [Psychrobacillus vulpis]